MASFLFKENHAELFFSTSIAFSKQSGIYNSTSYIKEVLKYEYNYYFS